MAVRTIASKSLFVGEPPRKIEANGDEGRYTPFVLTQVEYS
jgi:hypothetical protein